MSSFIDGANGIIWGYILLGLLPVVGIYFSIRSRFVQIRRFPWAVKVMFGSRGKGQNKEGISSFQAFCTSVAAHVGTGNLTGVAIAVYLGGPGAVFWMWLIAIVGMSTSLVENTLAQLYKTNNKDGTFRGGPAYYIQKGLGQRWLGIIFSICLIIAFGFAFNSVQSNSIALAMGTAYDLPGLWVGIGLAAVASLIIFGGIRSISKVAETIVPAMALLYIVIALTVVALNFQHLPEVLMTIIKSAFGLGTAASGAIGYAAKEAMMQGVKRGLFSNEAGMGSSPNAAATATPNPNHPVTQGMVGMLGVFMDTIVICTATAAIILVSGQLNPGSGLTGIELTQAALSSEIGSWGNDLIAIAILMFGFTSLIANYYYGETSLRFLKENKALIIIYRVLVLATIVLGAVRELHEVWAFADLAMGTLALINLAAIGLLGRLVFQVLKDYDEQIDAGVTPTFDRKKFPFLDQTMDKDVWTSAESTPEPKLEPSFKPVSQAG